MKAKSRVSILVIIALTILAGLYIHSQKTRYSIHTAKEGEAYKIDHWTGRTWELTGDNWDLVKDATGPKEPQSDGDKAIELAKRSKFPGSYNDVHTDIYNQAQESKGSLRVIEWKAQKMDDQTYYVRYSIERDHEEAGWSFEVNLGLGIARPINQDDPELMKKYGLITPDYQKLASSLKQRYPVLAKVEDSTLIEEYLNRHQDQKNITVATGKTR